MIPQKPTYQELEQRVLALEKKASLLEDAKKELKDREEFLETVINHIPHQIFWKNKDLEYMGCNRRFSNVVGLNNSQAIKGMTDYDFNRDKTHAESYRRWDKQIIDSQKAVIDLEENYHDDKGNEGTVLTSKVPIYDNEGNCICLVGICTDITDRKLVEKEKENLIKELREALEKVKTLSGLLPICSDCKKIRDDQGYWNQVDSYIEKKADVLFSHSMCPECTEKNYGHQDWYIKMKQKKGLE